MIKILAVSFPYDKSSPGGAAKSFMSILEGLNEIEDFKLFRLHLDNKKLQRKWLNPFGIGFYLYTPKIIRKIRKIKPDIILTQTGAALPSIMAANLKKTPVINIIRDPHLICPKYVDIIGYGKACSGLINRKTCYQCINQWRSLRVLIGNRSERWEHSFQASFSSLIYKIRYIFCKLNIILFNRATINLAASKLMKSFLSTSIDEKRTIVVNITPIEMRFFHGSVKKENWLLFIVPRYESSHKGLDFILRLARLIPETYKIIIIGAVINSKKLVEIKDKILNYDHLRWEDLKRIYQKAQITLVPSFYTEAFGRIIIESILNGTPVISSPNCGANSFFGDSEFLKVVPINLSLWVNAIKEMIENPHKINIEQIMPIINNFSITKSQRDFARIIQYIVNREKE